jgi:prepilin-type N-terminal cleavage/methylation domain-containing protein
MRKRTDGLSLLELLVVVTIGALALSVTLPAMGKARGRAAAEAGAHELAIRLQALRWKSVTLGKAHGLYFDRDPSGWLWYEVRDGNGNGIRTREVLRGTDPTLSGPHRLEASTSLATPGLPPTGPFPEIPPGRGLIDESADPIRFGNTNLVSFGPLGTSSSGRIYVTDGRLELFAVVLFGRSGRVRVWRLDPRSRQWQL